MHQEAACKSGRTWYGLRILMGKLSNFFMLTWVKHSENKSPGATQRFLTDYADLAALLLPLLGAGKVCQKWKFDPLSASFKYNSQQGKFLKCWCDSLNCAGWQKPRTTECQWSCTMLALIRCQVDKEEAVTSRQITHELERDVRERGVNMGVKRIK